ncbi:MAG: type II secretion system protein [Candidatus Riflebacteria bacterium]|nr:type II secretion system protein [Candidatus Riflebacteria bacterium]
MIRPFDAHHRGSARIFPSPDRPRKGRVGLGRAPCAWTLARRPGPFGRGAFTLIEILVTIVIVGTLATMGVSKYTEFATNSRKQVCLSNQLGVNKGVSVWEAQNVAISKNSRATLTFNGGGDQVGQFGPLPDALVPGRPRYDARNVARCVHDENTFMCPEHALERGGYQVAAIRADLTYMWISDVVPLLYLNNNRRGVACLRYSWSNSDQTGPDGTPSTLHR